MRDSPLPTKGPIMTDMLLALALILAVGAAFNFIGALVTKK